MGQNDNKHRKEYSMMKKYVWSLLLAFLAVSLILSGCGGSSGDTGGASSQNTGSEDVSGDAPDDPASDLTELTVRFGDDGAPFTLHLEDNSTASAIAGYVGTTQWRLPIYSYDESDVMGYYDIPSRYDIPDNSTTVTEARAGDVFYSDPNRIVLYYRDAEINEEYTKIGTFDATDEFISAVENNPVLEGWGNQIVVIGAES